jgi:hypothetical protein
LREVEAEPVEVSGVGALSKLGFWQWTKEMGVSHR